MEGRWTPRLVAGNKELESSLLIFDKDGTLVDQRSLLLCLARARENAIQKQGGKKVSECWGKMVGIDLKRGRIDHNGPLAMAPRREEVLLAAEAFYLNGYSWDEAKRRAQMSYDEADDSMKPPYGSILIEGIVETLGQLRNAGFKLAIASTDTHGRTAESFKALRIASLFDAIIGSDDVTNGKPAPDMIVEILKKTGCKSQDVVMIGDSTSDMQMGRNAEVKACVGVLTGSASKEKLELIADVVVASVKELHAG